MSFLSGNLSVLSGSRETLYTTQHSRYYDLFFHKLYIYLFSLNLQNYWIYIYIYIYIYGCNFENIHYSLYIAYTTCHPQGMKQTPRLR